MMDDILTAIPQRPPFLFVDRIISKEGNTIVAERTLREDEFYFQGHFPGNPIMPGVLLCEVCFQTGGMLMKAGKLPGLGVVTRIKDAKFRNFARPGDVLTITVTLDEQIDNAFYMSGTIKVGEKLIMKTIFQGAVISTDI